MTRPLLLPVSEVTDALGWHDPTPEQTAAATRALEDAHDDVEAFLGQPVTPTVAVEVHPWPAADGTWATRQDPIPGTLVVTADVDAESLQPTGQYRVQYTYGLDAANDPELRPIIRWVRAAAENHPRLVALWQRDQHSAAGARRQRSVSTDGQSVTWEYLTPGGATEKAAGDSPAVAAVPALETLDRWRIAGRRAYQRPTAPTVPFGFDGGIYSTGRWW